MKTITTMILALASQADLAWPDTQSLHMERSAAHYARGHVAETLLGLAIRHEAASGDIGGLIRETIDTRAAGSVRGVRVVHAHYDPARKWAVSRAEYDLLNMVPANNQSEQAREARQAFAGKRIVGFGFAATDPEALKYGVPA